MIYVNGDFIRRQKLNDRMDTIAIYQVEFIFKR